jgi:uncharacterized protein YbaA (DUF1428 family)
VVNNDRDRLLWLSTPVDGFVLPIPKKNLGVYPRLTQGQGEHCYPTIELYFNQRRTCMRYVDGYVLPVPKKNLRTYRRMAQKAAKVWRKHGALEYFECVGDDLSPKWAGIKFPRAVRAKPGETVVFSFIVFKSQAHRDSVNARVMKDPFMDEYKDKPMPFDVKRMAYGGFKVIVSA